jgi:hypothetical protein
MTDRSETELQRLLAETRAARGRAQRRGSHGPTAALLRLEHELVTDLRRLRERAADGDADTDPASLERQLLDAVPELPADVLARLFGACRRAMGAT